MSLFQPVWLLAILPIWALFRFKPMPGKIVSGLRIASLLCLTAALCGLHLWISGGEGVLVVLVDRSRSMPPGTEDSARELVKLMNAAKPPGSSMSVVSFGQETAVEWTSDAGEFQGFTHKLGGDESNLAKGLERALTSIPKGFPGRILVMSDGLWTGSDPSGEGIRAAGEAIPLDFRHLQRSTARDLAITEIDGPESVSPGEAFLMTAWVHSPISQDVAFELQNGKNVIESGKQSFVAGLNRITFRDRALAPGTIQYRLRISTAAGDAGKSGSGTPVLGPVVGDGDPVPENNQARFLLPCKGPRPTLLLSDTPGAGFEKLLREGRLNVVKATPETFDWSLEALSQYSSVIIENLPAERLGLHGMRNLAAWVREIGAGLMMTGGKTSFGPGGYFRSPLEDVMPVSMELRSEHRKLALGMVIVMDRSGSMSVPAYGGKTKMDLANMAAVQVLDLLGPMDEFGVIAVDSMAHVVVDTCSVEEARAARNKILHIESMGGGIFIYDGLLAGVNALLKAKAQNRHIILFADAADSEEPKEYRKLLEECAKSNITVSVVGLGKPKDCDAKLLEDIATRGKGRIFFTDDAEELPRIFAQDTFVVSRSTFVEEQTAIESTPMLPTLIGAALNVSQNVGGYNLCYLRPGAMEGVASKDDYKAPIVAAWNAGVGRSICYAGEVDGRFTGPIGSWKEIGPFLSSLARWAAGDVGDFAFNSLITQRIVNGNCRVEIHLDPDRDHDPFQRIPQLATVVGSSDGTTETKKNTLQWVTPDLLAAEVPLHGEETAINVVKVDTKNISLAPICLPYSPEFRPAQAGNGRELLERLARVSGGRERIEIGTIWKDVPPKILLVDVGPYLILAAILLLLLEILERRIHVFSRIKIRFDLGDDFSRAAAGKPAKKASHDEGQAIGSAVSPKPEMSTPTEGNTVSGKEEPRPETPLPSAFNQARNRARNRYEKD